MAKAHYTLPVESGFLLCTFILPCCSVSKAQTRYGESEWLPQFSTFRDGDKGGMELEQGLCVRKCQRSEGCDVVIHDLVLQGI